MFIQLSLGFFEAKAAALNDTVSEKDKEYREGGIEDSSLFSSCLWIFFVVKKKNVEKAKSKAAFKEKAAAFQ